MSQPRARFGLPMALLYVFLGGVAAAPPVAQAQDAIGEARQHAMMELRRMSIDTRLGDSIQSLSRQLLTKMQNVNIEFVAAKDRNCIANVKGHTYKGKNGRFGYSLFDPHAKTPNNTIYICPGPFKNGNNYTELTRTLVHEATHLLGYVTEKIPLSMDLVYASYTLPYPPDLSQDALEQGINNAATAANFIRALNLKLPQAASRPIDWRLNRVH
jgi:hypothetical protein